jgi:hypothetical protein
MIEIYVLQKNGDMVKQKEIEGTHAGAPFIWETLNEKYHVGCQALRYQELYKRMREFEEIDIWVLASTISYVIIKYERLKEYLDHLGCFVYDHPNFVLEEVYNELVVLLDDANVYGIGFNWNSSDADMWRVYEDGEMITYNINQEDRHRFL